jgi:hypothetical protein
MSAADVEARARSEAEGEIPRCEGPVMRRTAPESFALPPQILTDTPPRSVDGTGTGATTGFLHRL